MTLQQLVAKLIDLEIEYGGNAVVLEIGGDGGVHQGTDINVEVRTLPLHSDEPTADIVCISTEAG